MFAFERRKILGQVPLNPMDNKPIPEGAVIFNAPRPICGTRFGDYNQFSSNHMNYSVWLHSDWHPQIWGFTAIVTKDDPYRADWIKENQSLHSVVIEFISEENAKMQLLDHYREHYSEERVSDLLGREDFEELWRQSWMNKFTRDMVQVY